MAPRKPRGGGTVRQSSRATNAAPKPGSKKAKPAPKTTAKPKPKPKPSTKAAAAPKKGRNCESEDVASDDAIPDKDNPMPNVEREHGDENAETLDDEAPSPQAKPTSRPVTELEQAVRHARAKQIFARELVNGTPEDRAMETAVQEVVSWTSVELEAATAAHEAQAKSSTRDRKTEDAVGGNALADLWRVSEFLREGHMEAIGRDVFDTISGEAVTSDTSDPQRLEMNEVWDANLGEAFGTRAEWLAIDAGVQAGGAAAEAAKARQDEFVDRRAQFLEDVDMVFRAPTGLLQRALWALDTPGQQKGYHRVVEEMRAREANKQKVDSGENCGAETDAGEEADQEGIPANCDGSQVEVEQKEEEITEG